MDDEYLQWERMALEILTARFPNVEPDLLQAVLAGSTPENPQDFLTIIRGLKPIPGYTAETTPWLVCPSFSPPPPTAISLFRADVGLWREMYLANAGGFKDLAPRLLDLWNQARRIDGAPPPPPLPQEALGVMPGNDAAALHVALGALDRLLQWYDEAERPAVPAADHGRRVAFGKPIEPSKEALALAVLADHPDWSDTEIAKKAGCNRTTLYTFKKFMAAREILREGKNDIPRGSKFPDEGMEAWDNEGDE